MTEPKNEVVISGVGAMFPESDNLDELKELLFNKINGVKDNRFKSVSNDMIRLNGCGKLKNSHHFDGTFFKAHPKLINNMDTLTKILIERSVEAIIDAGLSPSDIYGTNTAVITCSSHSETETFAMNRHHHFGMLGASKTMQANRVSYILNLKGPSFCMEGGLVASVNALEKAKKMIQDGIVSAVLVGAASIVFRSEVHYQYQGLNKLNNDNQTKPFDTNADGYNRSDGCVVVLLQKASEAKRNYGTLLGVKSKMYGDNDNCLTAYSSQHFKSLLVDCYKEANIDPTTIDFVEAYGSGIKKEDTMELNVLEEVFCTEQRKKPLKVGSVKSNVGHCDVTSMFVSLAKAIIAFESGYIPPNINYNTPNQNVKALKSAKIQVVTEKTPLHGDIIGISTFCNVNAFGHVILKRHNKIKKINSDCNIPRLLLVSGRTEENVNTALKKINCNGNDEEFVALTNNVFTKNINGHFYRSFSIYPSLDEERINDVWNVTLQKRPIWFIFSGMGSQWQGMGKDLMNIPIFAKAVEKCDSVLKPRGIDIKNILTSQDSKMFDNILNSFVGIAAVQIGLFDILNALDVKPDGIIGHSVGELGCAYADGCFTAEEMILSAYARGRASLETELIPGMMAAIGLGYDQIKAKLPYDVDVACRNSDSSCTISGPVDSVNEFVSKLKSEGIFAKAVNVAGIAYHSRYIQSAGPILMKYLKDIIKEPKLRSAKWISSSIPESKWESDLAKYSSAEYHTNNLLNSVLFEDALKHIPNDAITIEIAPHGLLQAIIKGALPTKVTSIPLTKRVFGNSIRFLLSAIGKMYVSGVNPKIQELYPKISFPVARGTPTIHSLPFWNHTEQWIPLESYNLKSDREIGEKHIDLLLNNNIHLMEYQIHGHHIIPLSYILVEVWKMFIKINAKDFSEESVQFRNLWFKNNFKINKFKWSKSYFMIQTGSGNFQCIIDNEIILTGQVGYLIDNDDLISMTSMTLNINSEDFQGSLPSAELYDTLEKNGFNFKNGYKNIDSCEIYKNNIQGYINWENDWIYFLDGLMKFPMLENIEKCSTEAPVSIRQISIVPKMVEHSTEKRILFHYNKLTKEIIGNGIKISDIRYAHISLPKPNSDVVKLEEQRFINSDVSNCENIDNFISDAMDIIMEGDKLGLNTTHRKLIICTPYHYNDAISKDCINAIRHNVENQSIESKTMSWDNVNTPSEDDESGIFISVTNSNYLQDTTKSLANKTCSYIIVYSRYKLQDLKEWKAIIQQKHDDGNYLVLMKKRTLLDRNSVFIKHSNDDNDYAIWKALTNTKGTVYIVSNFEPLEGVKSLIMKFKTQRLRFLFILDPKAPDFESNTSFYTDRLSIGLIVNIYKAGSWATYKRIVVQNVKPMKTVVESILLDKLKYFKPHNLEIKHIGLNFNDLVVEDNTENNLGPLEYSGVNENEKNVMGIIKFNHNSSELHHDAAFSWPVPLTWTLEDATSVPLSYALSYYIFNVMCSLQSHQSLLVTSGLHPIGQAAISIAIAEKCETFVIVDSNHQADQLSHIFPELPRSRIVINTNNKFDIKLKLMKPKGFDLILNFLNGNSLQSAFELTRGSGKFFHLSNSDMKNQSVLRTRTFLKNIAFYAISSNLLLNECDSKKRIVQQAFLNGLNKGVVKPLPSHIITSFSSKNIFDMIRTFSTSVVPKKVILTLNYDFKYPKSSENIESNTPYLCKPDHVYVIIGNKSDWLDITEWLVNRGAKKVVISVSRYVISTTTCRRIDKLISQNISVHIESDFRFKTKEETRDWLNHLAPSNRLGSLFIVNQTNVKKIDNLRYAFENYTKEKTATSFICISSKGEHVCAQLKSIGLNALNISWNGASSQPKDTRFLLPTLDIILNKSYNTESFSFVCSNPDIDKSKCGLQVNDIIPNWFPTSADELQLFNDKITKETGFVEVRTKSPRLSELKSVLPVFIIPGFKPKLIQTLYQHFIYPTFEAQIPDNFVSINELSENLVDQLKRITDRGYVSIIGVSWGGNVALKMAQILEAQGTMVTLTLFEGDPEILTELAKSYLSNDGLANKLENLYNSFSNEISKYDHQIHKEIRDIYSYQKSFENVISSALRTIRFRLQALLDAKPLNNKLLTTILIIRHERFSDLDTSVLNDYFINPPSMYIIPNKDYKQAIADRELIKAVTMNMVNLPATGIEIPLAEKYRNFYFFLRRHSKI